jgi:hypothetical protein
MSKATTNMDMEDIYIFILTSQLDEYYIKSLLAEELGKLYKSTFKSTPKGGNSETTSNLLDNLGINISSMKPIEKVLGKPKGKIKNKSKLQRVRYHLTLAKFNYAY